MAERSKAPESGTDLSGHIVAWVQIPLSSLFFEFFRFFFFLSNFSYFPDDMKFLQANVQPYAQVIF
jgi:hypothetical protein